MSKQTLQSLLDGFDNGIKCDIPILAALNTRRVRQPPVHLCSISEPQRTLLARGGITNGNYRVKRNPVVRVPGCAAQIGSIDATPFQMFQRFRVYAAARVAPRTEGADLPVA